jgi:hypothetical protein
MNWRRLIEQTSPRRKLPMTQRFARSGANWLALALIAFGLALLLTACASSSPPTPQVVVAPIPSPPPVDEPPASGTYLDRATAFSRKAQDFQSSLQALPSGTPVKSGN